MTNEEKDRIIYALEYVCDEKRDSRARPFVHGEYIYATNGSVIVRRWLKEEDRPLFADYAARENTPTKESMEGLFDMPRKRNLKRFKSPTDVWDGLVGCRRKHQETCEEQMMALESYICPCCENTVYMDGDRLVDEETAEQNLITRYGIKVATNEGNLIFAGKPVYYAVSCIRRLGKVVDIGVYDMNLQIIGLDFECLIAGHFEDPKYDGPKTEIVGTFELN